MKKTLLAFCGLFVCSGLGFAQQTIQGSGTAGTAAGGVMTVQGVASMTPILSTSTQSGTWTVQPGNTANTTAWLVTGTGGTFPIVTWGGGTLGAMANYGTSPGAVLAPGVNAFVTNAGSIGTPAPSTSSTYAFSMYHHVFAGTGLNIKASAGNLYGFIVGNPNPIGCFLQFYNTAGTPTIGTSVIDSYYVDAGLTLNVAPGTLALENFATGIGVALATADAGATTTGCTTISLTAYYN